MMSSVHLTLLKGLLVLLHWTSQGTRCNVQEEFRKSNNNGGPLDRSVPFGRSAGAKGTVVPKPQEQTVQADFYTLDPHNFTFEFVADAGNCDVIKAAAERYQAHRLFPHGFPPTRVSKESNDIHHEGMARSVQLIMKNPQGCKKYPAMDMDEHYEIKVNTPDEEGKIMIIAFSNWGILRGLETFSQLIYAERVQGHEEEITYKVNGGAVMDFPRFSYRGAMLDTSRHYLTKANILANLDLMEMNKLNVFHWHLTDDQSFPYVSAKFPDLSGKGAFTPRHVYTQQDVADIIEAARIRGIRVVPEFDTPGHTRSWGNSKPNLLTSCDEQLGPFDPSNEDVFSFVQDFFQETLSVFPDAFAHFGGDEVAHDCWSENQKVLAFMAQLNITGDFNKLESYYVERLLSIIAKLDKDKVPLVWQEVFDNGDAISKDTVVHVWKGSWQSTVEKATKSGQRVVLSSPWYLNYISYGVDWHQYYQVEPTDFGGGAEQQKLVMGGVACIWGEYINEFNLVPTFWPRASSVAERLWSKKSVVDLQDAANRLEEHQCRMIARGHPVGPINGPGFCDV